MTYKIISIPQRTDEWYEFRKGKIGASMASAILGIDPWKSKLQLWEDIILDRKTPVTAAMQKGIDLEDTALRTFNHYFAESPFSPAVIQCSGHPEIIASLDGFNGKYHVELKITTKTGIPENYYAQLQHQMMVLGTDYCYYYASPDGMSGKFSRVEREESFIHNLLQQELLFIQSLVDYKAPEPSNRDEVSLNDPEMIEMANQYLEIVQRQEDLEMEKSSLRQKLINGCTHSSNKVGKVHIKKVIRKGIVDYAKIVEEYKIDQEKYRKNSIESWRIS